MSCLYCEQIHDNDPSYIMRESEFDLGKDWSRCPRHWRYVCSICGKPNHFQATFFCPDDEEFICDRCSKGSKTVDGEFWGWSYYWEYLCPTCGGWHQSLDYLEHMGGHPYPDKPDWEEEMKGLSPEQSLPIKWPTQVEVSEEVITDEDVVRPWNENAEYWVSGYDEYGDRNRKYQSDPVLFELLGPVEGLRILDAGSGNGYLCRLLTKRGAQMVGVELSERFFEIAGKYESEEPLGIRYHNGTISKLPYIEDQSFDAIVSNYVLMDCSDYEGAISEFWRVLKPGGIVVIVISHPCFGSPPGGWVRIPPDTKRREERVGWMVDWYFKRVSFTVSWADIDPPLYGFHRTLSDYLHLFKGHGFVLTDIEEPSISDAGKRELPEHLVRHEFRVPWSIIFRLQKPLVNKR